MNFFNDPSYPYPSRRHVHYARKGMVATSQPLAAQAGLQVLQCGGNAIDAAVATAAALTVVEPTANGIGGDAFALIWHGGKLHGLNASGPAPRGLSRENFTRLGLSKIPDHGPLSVTVPGTPAAWAALSERFGRLPLATTLQAAIDYARDGYPVSPAVAYAWHQSHELFRSSLKDNFFRHWFDTFGIERTPAAGELWRSAGHAATLESIAETKASSFYRGALADQISTFMGQCGGPLDAADLADYAVEWVDPISINYRGFDVWEIPPNGHGLVALIALNILKGFEFSERDTVLTHHRQIEAVKLAFADGLAHIADPSSMKVSVKDLLSDAYAAERRALIAERAVQPLPGTPSHGGTVYLCTADSEGNMVSLIQSNYMGFGSGLVVPGTGIALHNRGNNFSLDADHPNCVAPGKRPYHTIIPGFMTREGKPIGPFGVMGGFMQPQGHVQMVMNTIDFGLNPQASLDAPRWEWERGNEISLEHTIAAQLHRGLADRGHAVRWSNNRLGFGRGQIIWRDASGTLCGATEPRADGCVAGW